MTPAGALCTTAMQPYPSVPAIDDADTALFDGGHVWLREWIDGEPLRFRLQESGIVEFGDATRIFDHDDVPGPYRHAIRHVRERLNRTILGDAVDSVEDVVFFCVATQRRHLDYNWDRLPSVLGIEIWTTEDGRLPPDTAERVYERLGLEPINTFKKEVAPRDFDPDPTAIPESNWYAGPAAGLEIRNTRGPRAKILNPSVDTEMDPLGEPIDGPAASVAREFATENRFEGIIERLDERNIAITVDSVYDRLLEEILRVYHLQLNHPQTTIDMKAFRSALASMTSEYVANH